MASAAVVLWEIVEAIALASTHQIPFVTRFVQLVLKKDDITDLKGQENLRGNSIILN